MGLRQEQSTEDRRAARRRAVDWLLDTTVVALSAVAADRLGGDDQLCAVGGAEVPPGRCPGADRETRARADDGPGAPADRAAAFLGLGDPTAAVTGLRRAMVTYEEIDDEEPARQVRERLNRLGAGPAPGRQPS
ncbi:hypothetical protein [Micromonospora mirobrigensis]|uniref:Tetratricopeptide repeat protein n=1 Tax=Micromonospora mirobrigensis TaxID=262898 RepID=A0A1C4V211_9ACTN|nr:hypothetical protein [Micromonospora mirobrigensis]SCE77887.1 hypothetical protein GA0070564_101888 [Micromonospora mirobrigensis]